MPKKKYIKSPFKGSMWPSSSKDWHMLLGEDNARALIAAAYDDARDKRKVEDLDERDTKSEG